MKSRVLVMVELDVDYPAKSPTTPTDLARAWLARVPHSPAIVVIDTTIKSAPIASPDERIISHLPNLPREQLVARILTLTVDEQEVLFYCFTPRPRADVVQYAERKQMQYPHRIIAGMKTKGWLARMADHVEMDSYTDFSDAKALFTSLNHTHTHTHTR